MILTTDERKEKFYKLVLERGNRTYSEWNKKKIRSKQLVVKAREYAASTRLKKDFSYRFQALVFACALLIRLKNRYGTVLRKIFLLFAFLRERKALNRLKGVLGFSIDTGMRELIVDELEKIFLLREQSEEDEKADGGKRAELVDIELDEELEKFLEEYGKELEQQAVESEETLEISEKESVSEEGADLATEEVAREKISVGELFTAEAVESEKKIQTPTKAEKIEKTEKAQKSTEVFEQKKEEKTVEKPVEKSVANTSILAEKMVAEQARVQENASPFPVFREGADKGISQQQNANITTEKGQSETQSKGEKTGNLDKGMNEEGKQYRSPFPVFRDLKGNLIAGADHPTGMFKESLIEGELKSPVYAKMVISEENKVRIGLNCTMTDDQIHAYADQLQESAKMILAEEEIEWREKVSVVEGANKAPINKKGSVNAPNGGTVSHAPKK